jgi:hypothetical protein
MGVSFTTNCSFYCGILLEEYGSLLHNQIQFLVWYFGGRIWESPSQPNAAPSAVFWWKNMGVSFTTNCSFYCGILVEEYGSLLHNQMQLLMRYFGGRICDSPSQPNAANSAVFWWKNMGAPFTTKCSS